MTPALPRDWSLLSHRVTEVPLRGEEDRVAGRHRIESTLAVAHGAGSGVSVAWVRGRRRGPVQVLVGGVETGPEAGDVPVGFPLGARGKRQSTREIDDVLSPLHWECARLTLDAGASVAESLADRLEDVFALTAAPMAFHASARPVAAEAVNAVVDALSDELARLEALRSGRGVHRRQLARVEQNLEYLDRCAGLGCWELEVWTGGVDEQGARVAAALLAGSADLAEVPLLLRPAVAGSTGAHTWSGSLVAGTDAVASLVRPPFRELPGVRVTPLPEFDQNVEDTVQLRLGSVLDGSRSPAAPFGLSLDSVNRHVFVSGATGAGKSETVRSLLLSLDRRRVPWTVIEPAKAEYASLAPWIDPANPIVVVRPGDPDAPPPMLNPLEPSSVMVNGVPRCFALQTHLDMVKALFTASFDAEEPFPQVLTAALTRAYQARGWNVVTGSASDPALAAPEWPVLGDLVNEALGVVEGLGYGAEVRDNMRGFIRVRIESLRSGTPGRFFEGGYPIDLEDLLARPAVFEIEDLGDDRDKAFFIGNLIIRIVELLRLRQRFGLQQPGLSHVLVIEEAHRLLRRVAEESPSAHAVTMFANLLAEIRSYGEGVVVAEQIPSKVIPDLVKNSAVKLMHRLPAEDDRAAVGATMNLTDAQSAHVVALEPGVAVGHSAGMDRPVLVRVDRVSALPRTGAAPSAPSLGRRSGGDPQESTGNLLTLGQLESARDLVTPAVSLWAEQVVVAHLAHSEIRAPSGPWLAALQRAGSRRSRCALGLAVDAAVSRRFVLIRTWHDPAEFAQAVTDLMHDQLQTGRGPARPRRRWAVGQYQLSAVWEALEKPAAGADQTVPHPATDTWRASGLHLPGPTWADQLAQLEVLAAGQPQVREHELAGSPGVLDDLAQAVGQRGNTPYGRLWDALKSLGIEHRWLGQLTGASDG